MKKFRTGVLAALAVLFTTSTSVFAYSCTIDNCPFSGGYTTYNAQYANHQGHPGTNYQIQTVVFGYYMIQTEWWNCDYCGTLIQKQTIYNFGLTSLEEKNTGQTHNQ